MDIAYSFCLIQTCPFDTGDIAASSGRIQSGARKWRRPERVPEGAGDRDLPDHRKSAQKRKSRVNTSRVFCVTCKHVLWNSRIRLGCELIGYHSTTNKHPKGIPFIFFFTVFIH